MSITPIEEHPLARWAGLLAPARQLAEVLADTDFVPAAMRGKPDEVCATIMLGDELQLGPMQALAGIHVVEGRPAPSAELARALILRAGHTFTIHEMTGTRCRVSGVRQGRPEAERVVVEWTADMAGAAGLLGRGNWRRYPRAMLLARATGDLARILFPDVVKGLGYIAEDDANLQAMDGWAPAAGAPEPQAPTRPPVQRRTRPTRQALGPPPQADQDSPAAGRVEPPPVPDVPTSDQGGEGQPEAAPSSSPPDVDQGLGEPAVDQPPVAPPPPGRHAAEREQPAPVGDDPIEELQPEPAPDEPPPPEAGPQPIGDAPLRALHAGLGKVLGKNPNPELDRMERLELLAVILGRDALDSSRDLTRQEGYRALDFLGRLASGAAVMWRDEDGTLKVADNPEPAPARTTQQPPSDPWGDQPPLPEEPPGDQ